MRNITNTTGLAEITKINVEKDLPQTERKAEFKRQIRDMGNYTCTVRDSIFNIRAVYAVDGTTIEDCFRGMMA